MPHLFLWTTILAIAVTTLFAVATSVQARSEAKALAHKQKDLSAKH